MGKRLVLNDDALLPFAAGVAVSTAVALGVPTNVGRRVAAGSSPLLSFTLLSSELSYSAFVWP